MDPIQTITVFGCILLFSYAAALPADKLKHYHGYQVIRASPETPGHFQVIHELIAQDKYDFWRKPSRSRHADVMLSPMEYDQVTSVLQDSGIPFYTMIPNVEIFLEQGRQRKLANAGSKCDMNWEEYHTWDEINTWLSNLVVGSVNNSNILITSDKYGTSLEGRDLMVYKVSRRGSSNGNSRKSAIWIDATTHAREHITTAVITYIINELVTNSTAYPDILEHVDFYFVPFVNPDGFVYSHEVDRLWRKTRSNWLNTTCIGVDPNRNFGFHWGELGTSDDPCSSGYHGPKPYSEPETKAIRDYILDKAKNVSWVAYVTLHSYGQYWMSPWGYTAAPPEDHSEALEVAQAAVAEMKSYFNMSYTVGSPSMFPFLSDLASGTSQDWAKGEGGFKFVYTLELRDTGRHGFLLPAEQIVDTSVEIWAGLQVLTKEIARKGSLQK